MEASDIINWLGPMLTADRRHRIDTVICQRTRKLVPVLENLYDRGNASAVIRSAEGLGIQDFHIIETNDQFKKANRVTRGAEGWVDIWKWKNVSDCFACLRKQGFKILGASLENSLPIGEVSFLEPTAVVFGNEKEGLSEQALQGVDQRICIPMFGFSQSFNISVAAALILYHIRSRLTEPALSAKAQEVLKARFYMSHFHDVDALLDHLGKTTKPVENL